MQKRRFILVTLRPLIVSPLENGRKITGLLSGLPVKNDREFISLWNQDDKKHHITGIQGNMISKMHWLLGDGEDAEEGIVFFGPRRDSEGRIDVLETKKVMRKAVNLVGVLFKKLIVSSNVEPDESQLIALPDELHLGYPNHDFATGQEETEEQIRKRIEKAAIVEKGDAQKGSLAGAVGPQTQRRSALFPANNTPATRAPVKTRVTHFSREPTLLTRRPNQHVKKRVAEIRELLREKVDEVQEKALTVVAKTGGGNGSAGSIARRTGGAAGSLCSTCAKFYECQRQVEDYTCSEYLDDIKNRHHVSRYPDGL